MKNIKAGIIGGAGYTGGELIRILLHHPDVTITFVHSRSNAGKHVHTVHQDLIGETELKFSDKNTIRWEDADVLFLCSGHGEAKKFLEEQTLPAEIKLIDLSHDFRLQPNAKFGERHFIYGLPEINREQIRTARDVANPGCFATAIQLGLLPLAKLGILDEVYTTAITGSTGAGQGLSPTSHFSWRANNVQAYKTLTHQHLKEINQSLVQLGSPRADISFIPWRGDFTRGIFASSTITCDLAKNEISDLYASYFSDHPFTIVSGEEIFLKQVVNTNKCLLQVEKVGTKLVIHTALDNLVKGASGQAVQNMNLMFGLDETTGLRLKASAF